MSLFLIITVLVVIFVLFVVILARDKTEDNAVEAANALNAALKVADECEKFNRTRF